MGRIAARTAGGMVAKVAALRPGPVVYSPNSTHTGTWSELCGQSRASFSTI
jgi:hypothetical protein